MNKREHTEPDTVTKKNVKQRTVEMRDWQDRVWRRIASFHDP